MASLFCPFCGTENPTTRQFCLRCASDLRAPVRDPNTPAEPAPAPAGLALRPILIGGGIALVAVALLIAALVLLGGSPAASPSAAPTASAQPTAALTPAPTAAPLPTIAEPSPTLIAAPPTATAPSSAGSPAPGKSGTPVVDSLTGPRSASCNEENGTGTVGYIRLKWAASNTTGVRLSIDPPAANKAYDYGFDDYAAIGSADVPFTCDPPKSDAGGAYHLYVATTVHDGGYFAWRFIKVYVKA